MISQISQVREVFGLWWEGMIQYTSSGLFWYLRYVCDTSYMFLIPQRYEFDTSYFSIPNLMYVSFLHDWRRFWRRYNFASHCCCQNQLLVTFDSKTLIESSKIKETSMSGSSPQPSAWTPLWLEVLASLAIWCCKNFDGAENVATALKEPLRISFANRHTFNFQQRLPCNFAFPSAATKCCWIFFITTRGTCPQRKSH